MSWKRSKTTQSLWRSKRLRNLLHWRPLRWGLALGFLATGVVTSWAWSSYPGVSGSMLRHASDASIAESRNLMRCINYWLSFMQHLGPQGPDGIYGFPDAVDDSGDTDRCLMAFHRGEFDSAVGCLEDEIATSGADEDRLFWLAMSAMRLAEQQNCFDHLTATSTSSPVGVSISEETATATPQLAAYQHASVPTTSDHAANHSHHQKQRQRFCTLPLESLHRRQESAQLAANTFEELLSRYGDNDLYRWLLNFSHMTLGNFPHQVPAEQRIDSPFIDSFYGPTKQRQEERYAHLRFDDRAAELGVDEVNAGRGVAVEDFDGDGYLDIVTGGAFESLRFLRNQGGTHFEDITEVVGLDQVSQPFAISAADFDNDGRIDLFVCRPFDRYRLFRNLGLDPSGTLHFEDVTESSGLAAAQPEGAVAATWSAAWGDVDNDGDLDLFLAQWGMAIPFQKGLMAQPRMDSALFINQLADTGRSTFEDRSHQLGLADLLHDQFFVGASFGDMDDDGDVDLFLSSPLRLGSLLLENRGDRFASVDQVERGDSGFYAAFVDVDHDGRLDLFQGGFSDATTSTEMAVFGRGEGHYKSGHSAVLRQHDDGRFRQSAAMSSHDMPMGTMGASFGDLDNDGCYDFYLGTGNPEGWFVLPNLMYRGLRDGHQCNGQLDNISMLQGFGSTQKGHGIVFFDFDEDGDQDIYSSLGGMWPADAWPNQLFVNDSALDHHWVKVRLRGRQSNHFGVGARLTVRARSADGQEIVRHRQMDNKTGFGSAPYLAHIGLLDAQELIGIEVYWPVSGCRHTYDAALDALNLLDEAACSEPLPTSMTTAAMTTAATSTAATSTAATSTAASSTATTSSGTSQTARFSTDSSHRIAPLNRANPSNSDKPSAEGDAQLAKTQSSGGPHA